MVGGALLLAVLSLSPKQALLRALEGCPRGGIGLGASQRQEIHRLCADVEQSSLSTFAAPATTDVREALVGQWEVLYTDAPPPSNGQLGPFSGRAVQCISAEGQRYANVLLLQWLTVRLDAAWEAIDPAAWLVRFESLTFELHVLGREANVGPTFAWRFSEGVTREWRYTHTDHDMRIVRAGVGAAGKVTAVGKALRGAATPIADDFVFVLRRSAPDEVLPPAPRAGL